MHSPQIIKSNYELKNDSRVKIVLLIYSFRSDEMIVWDTQIYHLRKNFDLLIPDLVFFGDPTTKISKKNELFQVECMKNRVEFIGIESVIMVGHSDGGFIALWVAHKYLNVVNFLPIVSYAIFSISSIYNSLLKEYEFGNIIGFLFPIDAKGLKMSLNVN